MKDWVKIYSTSTPHEAEIFRGILTENDVEVILINKQDSAYLFGEVELYVKPGDVIVAKRLISHQNNS